MSVEQAIEEEIIGMCKQPHGEWERLRRKPWSGEYDCRSSAELIVSKDKSKFRNNWQEKFPNLLLYETMIFPQTPLVHSYADRPSCRYQIILARSAALVQYFFKSENPVSGTQGSVTTVFGARFGRLFSQDYKELLPSMLIQVLQFRQTSNYYGDTCSLLIASDEKFGSSYDAVRYALAQIGYPLIGKRKW